MRPCIQVEKLLSDAFDPNFRHVTWQWKVGQRRRRRRRHSRREGGEEGRSYSAPGIELHAGRLLHSGLAAAVLIETLAPAPAPLLLLFLGGAAMAS